MRLLSLPFLLLLAPLAPVGAQPLPGEIELPDAPEDSEQARKEYEKLFLERMVQKGNENIEEAKALIEQKAWRQALNKLELGLSRAPANMEGRIILTRLYMNPAVRQPRLALELLVEGMRYNGNHPAYVAEVMQQLLKFDQYKTVIDIANDVLPDKPTASEVNRVAAQAAANAHYNTYDYLEAIKLIEAYDLHSELNGLTLWAMIMFERGAEEDAIRLLESALAQFPAEDEILLRLGTYAREAEFFDKAEKFAKRRIINNPLNPSPRIELIYTYHRAGEKQKLDKEIEEFISEFGNEEQAVFSLANFATDYGKTELGARLLKMAEAKKDWKPVPFALLQLENLLEAKRYRELLTLAREFTKYGEEGERYEDLIACLRCIAQYGLGNEAAGNELLEEIIGGERKVALTDLLALSLRLDNLGRHEQAGTVIREALDRSPIAPIAHLYWIKHQVKVGDSEGLDRSVALLFNSRRLDLETMEKVLELLKREEDIDSFGRENLVTALEERVKKIRDFRIDG